MFIPPYYENRRGTLLSVAAFRDHQSEVESVKSAPSALGQSYDALICPFRRAHLHTIPSYYPYRATPLQRANIPKPYGGTRLLGISALEKKIVQEAVVRIVLMPIWDTNDLLLSQAKPHSLQIPCYSLIGLKKFPDTLKRFPVPVSREFDHKVQGLCGIQAGQRAGKSGENEEFPCIFPG